MERTFITQKEKLLKKKFTYRKKGKALSFLKTKNNIDLKNLPIETNQNNEEEKKQIVENKLYRYMSGLERKTSLINKFFTSDNESNRKNSILRKKDIEEEALEEYTHNKRILQLEYNNELKNILIRNYKRFQYPKVTNDNSNLGKRFENYAFINQKDINLGRILENLKKNYILNNKNKPRFFLNINKSNPTFPIITEHNVSKEISNNITNTNQQITTRSV